MRNIFMTLSLVALSTACRQEEVNLYSEPLTESDNETEEAEEEELEESDEPCPKFIDVSGMIIDDELIVISDHMASSVASPSEPIRIMFDAVNRAPAGCGGFEITHVGWIISTVASREEYDLYSDTIIGEEASERNPIANDFYEVNSFGSYEMLSSNTGPFTVSPWAWYPESLQVGGGFARNSGNMGLEPVLFEGGDDWRTFVINIFLGDRLPPGTLSITVYINYEKNGNGYYPAMFTKTHLLY